MANEAVAAEWLKKRARIGEVLKRLSDKCEDHFDADPEEITWADYGSLAHIERQLQEISDQVFQEGGYAPEVKC